MTSSQTLTDRLAEAVRERKIAEAKYAQAKQELEAAQFKVDQAIGDIERATKVAAPPEKAQPIGEEPPLCPQCVNRDPHQHPADPDGNRA